MVDGVRTLVLGFDGMDRRYLDRFADAMPTLSRLRSEGVSAPLDSTDPPWTASAWPSMYTGVDPSHHGVYGFFTYDYPDDGRVVTRNDVDAPALWNYLSAREIPSVVMNLPVTHPAEPMTGALIPGYLADETEPGVPDGIRRDVSSAIGEQYRIYSSGELADDPDEKFEGYLDLIDLRRRAAVETLSDREWELAVVQVQKTDAVFHNFEEDAEFRAVYGAADDLAASVIDAVDDPVNVVVCSDHGMRPKHGYLIQINDVLRREGYVEASSDATSLSMGEAKPGMVGRDDGAEESSNSSSLMAGGIVATERLLASVGVTPGHVYGLAKELGVEEVLMDIVPDAVRQSAGEGVDWQNSLAYCRSGSRQGVRINLQGREPEGKVPPEEYDRVRSELIDLLEGLRTPDGEPAFERVLPREAVYDGPHVDAGPDVIVRPRDDHRLANRLYGREFVPIDTYDHDPTGVFIGHGPGFDNDASPGRLSLTDVAPVAMSLLGQPVPRRMTGTAREGILSVPVERADYGDVTFGAGRTTEGTSEDVTDALADLGYL